MSEGHARGVIRILADVIDYLHRKGIVYRNMRPENVMVEDFLDSPRLKLVDFSEADFLPPSGMLPPMTPRPSIYLSPELMRGLPHGAAVDNWGLVRFHFCCLRLFCFVQVCQAQIRQMMAPDHHHRKVVYQQLANT